MDGSKQMPGSKGEHLDPGGLFRVVANCGGASGEPAGARACR
jgi:hypothetical protein